MFCYCGSMMFQKNGKFVCKNCGAMREVSKRLETFNTASKGKEIRALSDERVCCYKCRSRCICVERNLIVDDEYRFVKERFYCESCGYSWTRERQ